MRTMFVYFIQAENGYFKIGKTVNLKNRLAGLRNGCPCKLNLVAHIKCSISSNTERTMHEKFKKFRSHGEWFKYSNEILDFIKSLKTFKSKNILYPFPRIVNGYKLRKGWRDPLTPSIKPALENKNPG